MEFEKKSRRKGKDVTFYLKFETIQWLHDESKRTKLSMNKIIENMVEMRGDNKC